MALDNGSFVKFPVLKNHTYDLIGEHRILASEICFYREWPNKEKENISMVRLKRGRGINEIIVDKSVDELDEIFEPINN